MSLNEKHRPTGEYVRELREKLKKRFPGVMFYFLPADMVSQILNFGLPAPIDVQVVGQHSASNRVVAEDLMQQLSQVPGIVGPAHPAAVRSAEVHGQRGPHARAAGGLHSERCRARTADRLSGSFQTTPTFYLNPQNHISYNIAVQTPQYQIDVACRTCRTFRSRRASIAHAADSRRTWPHSTRGNEPARGEPLRRAARHRCLRRRSGHDLKTVAADIRRRLRTTRSRCRPDPRLSSAGRLRPCTPRSSGLLTGCCFSIVLVYVLIVVNFQ